MPSKKIYLKCSRPFIHGSLKTEAAIEQMELAKRSLGSYFLNKHSTRKGTGLTDEEVKVLLPQILDIQPGDVEFRKKVELFYTEINTDVPYVRGREFEIGLEIDNDLPITHTIEETVEVGEGLPPKKVIKHNLPINFEDYVRFRHAFKHPLCAQSPEDAKGNQTVKFYLEDPENTIKLRLEASELADKASMLYQQIKTDSKKVLMILSLARLDLPRKPNEIIVPESMNEGERQLKLKEFLLSKPQKFYAVASDAKLKNKYIIEQLISVNLLKRAGTSILITESSEVLGINLDTAMDDLFSNPARVALLSELKAKYDDIKSIKV